MVLFFEENTDLDTQIAYIKQHFDNTNSSTYIDETRNDYGSYSANQDGVEFWNGSVYTHTSQKEFLSWAETVAQFKHIFDKANPLQDMIHVDFGGNLYGMALIDRIIKDGSNQKDSRLTIATHYAKKLSKEENIEFLKEHYKVGGKGVYLGKKKISIWFSEEGIQLAQGKTVLNATNHSLITWNQLERRIAILLDNHTFLFPNEMEQTHQQESPSISSVKTIRRFITEDEINTDLARGSSVSDGKYRIFSHFLHNHSKKETIAFLKNEYGIGGRSFAFNADNTSEDHNAKGITYVRRDPDGADIKIHLPWKEVASRLEKLIHTNNYMTEKEMANLANYEKDKIISTIYYFFDYYEAKPFPFYTIQENKEIKKEIENILTDAPAFDNLLKSMAELLDEQDYRYEWSLQAYQNVLAYQKNEFSLFPQRNQVRNLENKTDTLATGSDTEQLSLFEETPELIEPESIIEELTPLSISQQDIAFCLLKGTGIPQDFSLITEQFKQNGRRKETATFLKELHGTTKQAIIFPDNTPGNIVASEEGLEVIKAPLNSEPIVTQLSWPKVQQHIAIMIQDNTYLPAPSKIAINGDLSEILVSDLLFSDSQKNHLYAMSQELAPSDDMTTYLQDNYQRVSDSMTLGT
ncbi:hypothetical protein JZO73_13655 [Enterococcus plantarum]|nr:hypothetical protein [Enterococcus plantarum]